MHGRARHLVFGVCVSSAVLAVAAAGWACTVMASITLDVPRDAGPGTQVVVQGTEFVPEALATVSFEVDGKETPVAEKKVDSNGVFTVRIDYPNAPGRYSVIARVPGPNPGTSYEAPSKQFTVAGQSDSLPPPGGGDSTPPTTTPPSPLSQDEPAHDESLNNGGGPNDATATSPPVVSSGDPGRVSTSGERSQSGRGSNGGSGGSGAGGAPGAGGTPPASAGPTAAAPAATPDPSASPTPLPSPRSATDELWSGFSDGPRRSVNSRSLSDPAPAADSGGMTAGLVLLTIGLMALGAAAGVVTVRRRRAPATTR